MSSINKSDDLERLVGLYLRLNGYFSDGFIVHSEQKGNVKTEVDLLGVRFPYHFEREREILTSDMLSPPTDKIDVVICEVKSGTNQPHFNAALTKDIYRLPVILRRVGILSEDKVPNISHELYQKFLEFEDGQSQSVVIEVEPNIQIRGLLFSPELTESNEEQVAMIDGSEIMDFIYCCLCPATPRPKCSTKYDLGLWGVQYGDIVTYFKKRKGHGAGTATELCNALVKQRV